MGEDAENSSMGSFSSKMLKNNCTEGIQGNDKRRERVQIMDPRSPTGAIIRTPITVEKDCSTKTAQNNSDGKASLTKQRLLKNLKLDPRSPSDGINRTPIFLENTNYPQSKLIDSAFESPLSIYSSDFCESDSLSNIMTPVEPSVNVSGFGTTVCDVSINDQIESETDNLDENEGNKKSNTKNATDLRSKLGCDSKTPLKISTKPSTMEARKLLNEILLSDEFDRDFNMERKVSKKSQNGQCFSNSKNSSTKFSEKKKDKFKYRTPLSNITMSSNSPSHSNSSKKPYSRCKIMADTGSENTQKIQIAQWDNDSTVII